MITLIVTGILCFSVGFLLCSILVAGSNADDKILGDDQYK